MQARLRLTKILAVALIASLVLSACGGGTSGSTWFNLPSIPLNVQPDGSVSTVLGLNLGAIPAVQQLQGTGFDRLEVRIGYSGIMIYANGTPLPMVTWSADAVETLQGVLRNAPQVPNGAMIANLLPWLRTIGLGVAINLTPAASGVARWSGETPLAADPPTATTIGPINVGSVAFDETGNLNIGSVPGSDLGLGPLLDANTLGMLQSFGITKVQVTTQPGSINLSLNDQPLPGLAYNAAALEAAKPLINTFAPAAAPMVDQVVPILPSLALDAVVSFDGQPAGTTSIGNLPVVLNTDGTVSAFGIPVGSTPVVPADVMQKLTAAGVTSLNVDVNQGGLFLAANGQTLPTITWTPESLNTLTTVIAPLAGIDPAMISSGMALLNETGGIKASIGVGAEAAAADVNTALAATAAPGAPILHLNANVEGGSIQSIEGVGNLADLGVGPIALPPNVMQILTQLGASQVALNTDLGKADILLDGNTALTINWDEPSLRAALSLAAPFLADTPLADPNVAKLVDEQIVPLLPSADVDVTLNLN